MLRIVAAVLSVALTMLVLLVVRAHAPAGATPLIVSLDILRTGIQLLTIVLAVVLVLIVVTLLNLATGKGSPRVSDQANLCCCGPVDDPSRRGEAVAERGHESLPAQVEHASRG